MSLTANIGLAFDGCCREAFQFYERCLNGKITFMMTWAESPMAKDAPPGWENKILHATLDFAGTRLQGADARPGTYARPAGFSITLSLSDPAEAERLFAAFAEGGTVAMPLEKTFWAGRFGSVTDKYGVNWAINCENA